MLMSSCVTCWTTYTGSSSTVAMGRLTQSHLKMVSDSPLQRANAACKLCQLNRFCVSALCECIFSVPIWLHVQHYRHILSHFTKLSLIFLLVFLFKQCIFGFILLAFSNEHIKQWVTSRQGIECNTHHLLNLFFVLQGNDRVNPAQSFNIIGEKKKTGRPSKDIFMECVFIFVVYAYSLIIH